MPSKLSDQLILVWAPGKGSPIHDHGQAHCLMKILHGRLTETRYALPDCVAGPQAMAATSQRTLEAASVAYNGRRAGAGVAYGMRGRARPCHCIVGLAGARRQQTKWTRTRMRQRDTTAAEKPNETHVHGTNQCTRRQTSPAAAATFSMPCRCAMNV